jgi:hypothetical protein
MIVYFEMKTLFFPRFPFKSEPLVNAMQCLKNVADRQSEYYKLVIVNKLHKFILVNNL